MKCPHSINYFYNAKSLIDKTINKAFGKSEITWSIIPQSGFPEFLLAVRYVLEWT